MSLLPYFCIFLLHERQENSKFYRLAPNMVHAIGYAEVELIRMFSMPVQEGNATCSKSIPSVDALVQLKLQWHNNLQ